MEIILTGGSELWDYNLVYEKHFFKKKKRIKKYS